MSDEAARRAIVERLDATMLVEAGAGTGKTRALVDRVVALVSRGTPIERIAAITFTDRAAAELRERVRAGLDERIAHPGTTPEQAERCARARDGLHRAQLSTIHAFGQSLLSALCAEAGIDPEITVLDQLTAERRFEERWRAALESLDPDGSDGVALDRALALGMRSADLRQLGVALTERGDIAERIADEAPTVPAPDWGALARMRDRLAGLPLERVAGDDKCLERIRELIALLDGLVGADGPSRAGRLAGASGLCGRGVNIGLRANWPSKDAIEEARRRAREVGAELLGLLAAARAEATAGVLPWVARTVRQDAALRRREGALVFNDLVLWTRDLLRDDAAARELVRRRYDVLLIDEFQDTDPWQVGIAEAFARLGDGRLEPGRLFMVGDPKQSIYRFRRADMAVYAQERRRVEEAGGDLPALTRNRRSRAPIIAWVNTVVGAVIAEERDRAIGPPYVPITAERSEPLEGPGVGWMGGVSDLRAREIRRAEAEAVAATCRAAIDQGWHVRERDGSARRARLRDVAVLLPTRTALSAIELGLRGAGVPYRVEGGSLVFRTQELRDIVNCLTAIEDPADEVAVVGALRSPPSRAPTSSWPGIVRRAFASTPSRPRWTTAPTACRAPSCSCVRTTDGGTTARSRRWWSASWPTCAWSRSGSSTAAAATHTGAPGWSWSGRGRSRPTGRRACASSSRGSRSGPPG